MGKTSKAEPPSGVWSDRLPGHWLAWMTLADDQLMLLLPLGNVPDMTGCVGMACHLMPEVKVVMVSDGAQRQQLANVCKYELHDGRWQSMGRGQAGLAL